MKLFRKLVILSHRYLGIVFSLLVMMWFASGVVMMYAGGLPRLTPQELLLRQAPLDLARVLLTPEQAAEQLAVDGVRGRVTLASVMNRPAYRMGGATVFADTGDVLDEVGVEQSRAIAGAFMDVPVDRVRFAGTLTDVDQWTLLESRLLPLHKFSVADHEGTEVYVSAESASVVMRTTSRSRALSWAGVIPHWLYFTALRTNQPLWYQVVVWLSVAACIVTVLGLILGVTQYRRSRPFKLSAAVPYAGWMKWHYVTGVVFGVFTLTWAFSGLISMEPFAWTRAEGMQVRPDTFSGGSLELARFGAIDGAAWQGLAGNRVIKEIELLRIHGRHYYAVRSAPAVQTDDVRRERLHQPYPVNGRMERERVLVDAETLQVREPFSQASIVARLQTSLPDAPIVGQELLTDYDSYYYSRNRLTPLPVLRVQFADPAETWVYIDPETSATLAQIPRLARYERWLFNGLHSLDFAFWYNRRPLWDIGMITLCIGGFASSAIGLFMGVRRMRRASARKVRAWTEAPSSAAAAPRAARSSVR
jgi:hypothetical protein